MDYNEKTDKYQKRYWFWERNGKNYVTFYYMTLAVVLLALFFPNIITFFLGGLFLLFCILYVPYGIWNKIGHTNYMKAEKKEAEADEKKRQNKIKSQIVNTKIYYNSSPAGPATERRRPAYTRVCWRACCAGGRSETWASVV